MSEQKLKNAPLKEVIFELFWEGEGQLNDIPIDPGYENAIGRLQERLEKIVPIQTRLYPIAVPLRVFGVPVFQYWKSRLQWPVIQHGPGVLTVNDTEINYTWKDNYKPLVLTAIDMLIDSYSKTLPFNKVSLKYVDAVDIPMGDVHHFVAENLRIAINYEYDLPGEKTAFNISQRFALLDGSTMQLQVSSGVNNQNNSPAIIWTTSIEKNGKLNKEEIVAWLDSAHTRTSDFFKTMLKPEYYASLDE